ncbi:DM13 domain-containing protein [Herpetosiphon gulosus]|uniref:DM13 domain-containing protein n=1 Tax=Herpetosiphon gulosus TaxID=1973496 RepID=A0ABP9WUY0_9CHLR
MKLRYSATIIIFGLLTACGTAPTKVDEPFPTTSSAAMVTAQPTMDSMMQTDAMSMTDDLMQPTDAMSMTDDLMQPTDAMSMTDNMMQPTAMPTADDMMQPTATVEPTTESRVESTVVPAEPVVLGSGSFRGIDHKSGGMATLYQQPDGSNLLRLSDFFVEAGPDMYIFVAKAAEINQPSDLQAGYLELGKLKGSEGNQNYSLPADFDPALYSNVVIWCEKYQVLMAVAPIQ